MSVINSIIPAENLLNTPLTLPATLPTTGISTHNSISTYFLCGFPVNGVRVKPSLPHILLTLFITTLLSNLHFASKAQCVVPALTFHSPVLLSGVDGQVGSIYKFAEVLPGVDAQIEITDLVGGATLNNIDDSAGVGYYDAFQPYVGAGANDTSYLEWKIVFKIGGTNVDTFLACLAITGVDVDGDGSALKEFIEAATPGSIGLDPSTNLTVSFDGVKSKAISPVSNIPLIDTFHLEAMFQMNFQNINTLLYRNGAITTGGSQVRQTCIYFRPFFQSYVLLAKTFESFAARRVKDVVELNWNATFSNSQKQFIVQRSEDARTWQDLRKIAASANGSYKLTDNKPLQALTYYRVMAQYAGGSVTYSSIVTVSGGEPSSSLFSHSTIFSNTVVLRYSGTAHEYFRISIYSVNGTTITDQHIIVNPGTNAPLNVPSSASPGNYLLVIKNLRGEMVHQARLVKKN